MSITHNDLPVGSIVIAKHTSMMFHRNTLGTVFSINKASSSYPYQVVFRDKCGRLTNTCFRRDELELVTFLEEK